MMLLLALLALCEAAIASNIPNYTELTFVQVVDHFNVISNETFKQRYLVTGEQVFILPMRYVPCVRVCPCMCINIIISVSHS